MAQLYSQILGLSKLDVYSETENNDNSYFDITGLPRILSYGKHPFAITFKDPENLPLLKNGSSVVFEFVDSRGTVIFSNLIDIDSLSGAGNGFIWIKKDPLRTADEIADGPAYFYVAGELGGKEIPNEWKGIYNIRSTFEYDIRKKYPNTSPIVLKTPNDIQLNSNFSESIDFDDADDVYKRSYVNVSASHMETNGGQVRFIELSYKESKSKSSEFKILSKYLVSGSTYEVSASVADGLNPISHEYKVPVPKDFRRDTPVTFKLRFLNPKSEVAQHYTASLANQDVEVTSSLLTFESSPIFIEKEDNLLKGSMYTGNAVGKGFEQSGKSSAFLKTVDYEGFISASVGSGSAGVMFFSGSVLTSSGDDYTGVGLELHGGKGSSSFKFRSNPSVLEVKADTFFVGSETSQFISGSGGNIEISSSLFHLNPATNTMTLSGSITANDGTIGGWEIQSDKLVNTQNTVELSTSTPGLNIKDDGGTERVSIKSGSFLTMGDGTQYIENRSFEDDSISAGRNFVSTINSWSFSEGGGVNISLTDRSGYVDADKAVSGDVTLDVVVPAGSGNYSSNNTYEISQVITASFTQGDTLSFSSVARFSSSFGGKGKDRVLQPQYFRVEYSSSTSNGFKSFLPANEYTESNGYGKYFLGSGQYNSFGASAEMPEAAAFVKLILTGSINDDTGYSEKKSLFAEGRRNKELGGKEFTKTVKGSTSAEYPETEITFDNFTLRSNTRKVELTEKGLLIYNSEDSYFKMTAEGIDYRGGSGVTSIGSMTTRESFTNDSQVAGTLGAPALQGYEADPENIHATTAFDGNVGDYSKGNHRHVLPFSVVNSVVDGETITNLTASNAKITTADITTLVGNAINFTGDIRTDGDIIAQNYIVSSSVTSITYQSLSGSTIFGDTTDDTHTFLGNTISGSASSTGSFGLILQNGQSVASVGGADTNVLINSNGVISGSNDFVYDDSSGRVGIGTTSPDSLLHTYGSSHFGYNTTHKHQFTGSLEISGSFLVNGGGVATTAGSDTHVQFNDGGSLGGDADFTYNKTTNKLSVLGGVSGSASSTGSFGRVQSNTIDMTGTLTLAGGGTSRILINNLRSIEGNTDGSSLNLGEDFTDIRMRADIRPESNNSHDLGTSAIRWKDLYLNEDATIGGNISGSASSTGSFGAVYVAGMSIPNLADFSSSIESRLTSEEADSDFTAAGISGSWQGGISDGSLTSFSGSASSTGSFGAGYIDNKLGIGTTSPSQLMHVYGTDEQADFGIRIGAAVKYWDMRFIGSTSGDYDGNFQLRNNTLTALTVLKSGNVGIGTTSPGNKLVVETTTDYDGIVVRDVNDVVRLKNGGGDDGYIQLLNSNSVKAQIHSNGDSYLLGGDVGIGTASPDELLHIKQTGNDFTNIKVESTANHADAGSAIQLTSNDGSNWFINHSTSRTTTRYGTALGGYTEILAQDSNNGLVIGTGTANTEIIFGVNNKEQLKITDNSISGSSTSTGSFGKLRLVEAPGAHKASPTLAFGDGNTGFFESSDNNFVLSVAADDVWLWTTSAFTGNFSNSPGFLRETATATNPVFAPLALDPDTGLGRAGADQLSLIAGGSEALRVEANLISGSSTSTGSFGSVVVKPTGKLYLDGGGDSYIYEHSANDIRVSVGGTTMWDFLSTGAGVSATSKLYLDGGGNTHLRESSADNIKVSAGGVDILDITTTKISGSSTSTGSFGAGYIDNKLGIGTTSPDRMMEIEGSEAAIHLDSSANAFVLVDRGAASDVGQITYATAGSNKWFVGMADSDVSGLAGTEFFIGEGSGGDGDAHLVITDSGDVGIGNTAPGQDLHIGDGTGIPNLKLSGTNTGTNPAATGHGASNIILHNAHDTDGNFSFIDGNNSNDAVDSRITFIHDNHSSRYGEIAFLVHNGSALTERVRFDKDGNVGIGTTGPAGRIHLKQATTDFYGEVIEASGNDAWIRMGHNGTYGAIHTTYNSSAGATPLILGNHNNQATQLVLATNNNVGIGTTSPDSKLHVSASSAAATQDILIVDNTVKNRALHLGTYAGNSSIQAKLTNGTTNKLMIQPSGSTAEFGGNISGSSTSTGSFGDVRIANHLQVATSTANQLVAPAGASTITIGGYRPWLYFRENDASSDEKVWSLGVNGETMYFNIRNDANSSGENWMTINRTNSVVDSVEIASNTFTVDSVGGVSGSSTSTGSFGSIHTAGNVGIGTTSPAYSLDISGNAILLGSDNAAITRTNSTLKQGGLISPHYTNAEEPHLLARVVANTGASRIEIGGGTSAYNSVKSIVFYTAADDTTVTGTVRMTIDSSGNLITAGGQSMFGTTLVNHAKNLFGGSWTSGGVGTTADGLRATITTTGASGDTARISQFTVNGTITTQAVSETVTLVSTAALYEPTITVGSGNTVTNSATLYIAGAATEATNDYALWVDDGVSRFDGNVGIGTTSPARTLDVTGTGRFTSNVDFGGSIYVSSGGHVFLDGGSNTYITEVASDQVAIFTGGSERFRVNASGNVGIGTASPTSPVGVASFLEVEGSTAGIVLHDSGGNAWDIFNSGNDLKFNYNNSGTSQMYLDANGSVGIGTDSPSYKLSVADSSADGRAIQAIQSSTSGTNWGFQGGAYGSGATKNIGLQVTAEGATTNYAAIFEAGNVGIGETSPDKKLHLKSSTSTDGIKIEQSGTGASMVTFFADSSERGFIGVDDSNGNAFLSSTSGLDYVMVMRSAQEIHFGTNGNNTAMVIDTSQNVGIGTTSPDGLLDVAKSAASNQIYLDTYSTTNGHNTILNFQKSANATIGTAAETADGESLGLINFKGVDNGGNFDTGAGIQVVQVGSAGSKVAAKMQFFANSSTTSAYVAEITSTHAISGSSTSTGSFGRLETADNIQAGRDIIFNGASNKIYTYHLNTANYIDAKNFMANTASDINFKNVNGSANIIGGDTNILTVTSTGNKISGSASSTGSFGKLHIKESSTVASQYANDIVINEVGETTAGMSILTSTSGVGRIYFGDTDNQTRAYILYDHSNDALKLSAASGNKLILDTNSRISLSNNDGNSYNTVFGYHALTNAGTVLGNVGADYNTAVGHLAIGTGTTTTATRNGAFGYRALTDITSGQSNQAFGYDAATSLTIGYYNAAFGTNSLYSETVGNGTTAIGEGAGYSQISDSNNETTGNTIMGLIAGYYNVTGTNNTYLGSKAGLGASGQSHTGNTAVGADALTAVTTGGYNVAVGARCADALTDGLYNVFLGEFAGSTTTSVNNAVLIGQSAGGGGDISADGTIAIGLSALGALTSGTKSTAVGYQALTANTIGHENTAFGYQALYTNVDGDSNTAIGVEALKLLEPPDGYGANTAVGFKSGDAATTASGSVFVGFNSGGTVTTGNQNIAIGLDSMNGATTTGDNNIAIGASAGDALTSGAKNVFIGLNAGSAEDVGSNNIGIGPNALAVCNNDTGANVAIGNSAGLLIVAGYSNTLVGNGAGSSLTGGLNNILLGRNAQASAVGGTNQIVLGKDSAGHGDNIAVIGNTDTTAWHPADDNGVDLGSASYRFSDVFAVQTTVGGIFEANLKTKSIGDNPTGTIVVWQQDKLVPCDKSEDELVMGVIKNGKDEPIVLGAEPVLVTGKVNVGDYIVTSNKIGHGKSVKRGYLLKKDLFGKVIAQALEKSDDSESCLIKCMIRKM